MDEKEPTYEYIKGQGWVPAKPVESITFEVGGYRFTVYKRKPGPGEYTWAEEPGSTLEQIKAHIANNAFKVDRLNRGQRIAATYEDVTTGIWAGYLEKFKGEWFTVYYEPING